MAEWDYSDEGIEDYEADYDYDEDYGFEDDVSWHEIFGVEVADYDDSDEIPGADATIEEIIEWILNESDW